MTAGEYSLVVSPTDPMIRIAETTTHMVIERPDVKESVSIPLDSFEMFVQMLSEYLPGEPDDDGDDDDEPADGESFDGGFGPGSYFNRAMHKKD